MANWAVSRDRKEWIVRLSGLVTVAALLFCSSVSPATSPPHLYEALEAQRAQASQNPNDPEILNDLGNLLVLAGSIAEAEEVYLQSLEISPDNTATRYNLALVLMEQGHRSQATKELNRVLAIQPQHAWSLYQLGTLSALAGRRNKAVGYYTKALALDPDLASPVVNPHIIENRYLTESQLRLYLAKVEAAQAPRLYQRPNQVAELLIPASGAEPVTTPDVEPGAEPESHPEGETLTWREEPLDQAGVDSEATEVREAKPTARWAPVEKSAIDQEDLGSESTYPQEGQQESSDSPRRLTEEDLVPTTVGQGVGYTGSSSPPSSTSSTPRSGGSVSYPRTTTPRPSSPSSPAPSQTTAPRTQPTPRPQSFVPSIGSTGRLDLELFFDDDTPAVAPGP